MGLQNDPQRFNCDFWLRKLRELGYPLTSVDMDLATLIEQRALPSDLECSKVTKLYSDDYTEIALLNMGNGVELRRSLCTKVARSWKENRLIRPLLIFTNDVDSYAVIVPGKGVGGEAKVLGLSDRLYRTDLEVLESMRFPGKEELSKNYDSVFFPYRKVRDEFFEGYRELYQKVEKAVRDSLKEQSASYAQRFLGRIMFLHFLQRKGWLKKDRRFVDSIKNYKELNRLFYESLNREGIPGIPFLNGSLFEKEPYMTAVVESHLCLSMDQVFKDTRNFLNDYNFTIDETSPLDVDVSIDPALLGTVFENMLPENERGSKGTFYTGRDEISFICKRALTTFLGLEDELSTDGKMFQDGLSKYVKDLEKRKSEKDVRKLKENLLSVRVLDPAVGSGGFLLVMMQEIISIIQEAEAAVGWKTDPEELKEKILPNLYGFDIESEATEITRLRLWLSLIIDQNEPEPLPNLDMNLLTIKDSLLLPHSQLTLDATIENLREQFKEVKIKYLGEHDGKKKKELRQGLRTIAERFSKKTGTDPETIEAFMIEPADIIVMNPPFVRQESIPPEKKEYYVKAYSLDKKSDLYAYFLTRSLGLISQEGVVSVISSDKWLETDYGISLQKRLKDHLVGIYSQKWKAFRADVHTAITVYCKKKTVETIDFTLLESYSRNDVVRHYRVNKKKLGWGKWPYLRMQRVFFEKILPKLEQKLGNFAEITRGFTTGANEFFYMKEINHLYETDYLADSKRFKDFGIHAKTRRDLEEKGLIYVENEAGKRFVINKEDVIPIIRSFREIKNFRIPSPSTLCLYTETPGELTSSYIEYGKSIGIDNRPTLQNRKRWYSLSELRPCRILLPAALLDRLFIPISDRPLICDKRLYTLDAKNPDKIWLYLNSTIFLTTIQLFSRKGSSSTRGAVMDATVEDYATVPVSDLSALLIRFDPEKMLRRSPLRYSEEIRQEDRIELDLAVLRAMGFDNPETLLPELYSAFLEVVEDRLSKGLDIPTDTREIAEMEVSE